MAKWRKEKDEGGSVGPSSEEQESIRESKRLRELAVSRGLLSRSKANPVASLLPTKTIRKCDGKDIVKKGNRKTKYLFAFPGLVAPVSGGKLGELTHLDSRNPVFYIDFPQGRLKLFGTIVYPNNKYLTMHFAPGRGDIVCEECFESIEKVGSSSDVLDECHVSSEVVFPDAWWIGTKEENPEELKLPMPSSLQQEKHTEFDFKGGAGQPRSSNVTPGVNEVVTLKNDPQSPEQQFQVERLHESPSSMEIVAEKDLPVRRSTRKSAEKLNYADTLSSSSDSEGNSDSHSDHSDFRRKGRRDRNTNKDNMQSASSLQPRGTTVGDKVHGTGAEPAMQKTTQNELETICESITKDAPRGGLKQATLTSFLSKTKKSQVPSVEEAIQEIRKLLEGLPGKPIVKRIQRMHNQVKMNSQVTTLVLQRLLGAHGAEDEDEDEAEAKVAVTQQLPEAELRQQETVMLRDDCLLLRLVAVMMVTGERVTAYRAVLTTKPRSSNTDLNSLGPEES